MPKADKIAKIANDVTSKHATRFTLEDTRAIVVGNRSHHPIETPLHPKPIASNTSIKMPMPGKTPEEQAKQGALQYAKAWGGTSIFQSHLPKHTSRQLTPMI
jgi:hypothetical protein